jgi:hypothetical protein
MSKPITFVPLPNEFIHEVLSAATHEKGQMLKIVEATWSGEVNGEPGHLNGTAHVQTHMINCEIPNTGIIIAGLGSTEGKAS